MCRSGHIKSSGKRARSHKNRISIANTMSECLGRLLDRLRKPGTILCLGQGELKRGCASLSKLLHAVQHIRPLGAMDTLTLFGLFAVTAMLLFYAIEDHSRWFILAFAGACALASVYGFL